MPEVVHARTDHGGERGKRGDVAAQIPTVGRVVAIGPHHHRHGVPAHVGADALLELGIARRARLKLGGDGVDVSRVRRERDVRPASPRRVDHLLEQKVGTLGALAIDDGLERIEPFPGFKRIGIHRVVGGRQLAGNGGHGDLLIGAVAARADRHRVEWSNSRKHRPKGQEKFSLSAILFHIMRINALNPL